MSDKFFEWEYFINWNNSEINRDIETRFSQFDYKLNSPLHQYSFKTFSLIHSSTIY